MDDVITMAGLRRMVASYGSVHKWALYRPALNVVEIMGRNERIWIYLRDNGFDAYLEPRYDTI